MKKYFKINQEPYPMPNFIMVDLIEKDKIVGGYIIPNTDDAKKFIIEHVKKEGYVKKINK